MKLELAAAADDAQQGGDRPSRSTTGRRPRRATARSRKRGGKGEGTAELIAARQGAGAPARHRAGALSPLRGRVGRVSDRHRAGVGDGHHRHGGADVSRRRPWRRSGSRSWRLGCSRRTRCICSERHAGDAASGAHAAADAPQQPQRARRPASARTCAASVLIRRLIGSTRPMRPGEPHQHVVVEPAEPGELQQLRPRQLEDEGGDAEARPAWRAPAREPAPSQ